METETEDLRICNLETAVTGIAKDVKVIKENHLAHMQISLVGIQKDMQWLKKFLWCLIIPIIIALIVK